MTKQEIKRLFKSGDREEIASALVEYCKEHKLGVKTNGSYQQESIISEAKSIFNVVASWQALYIPL